MIFCRLLKNCITACVGATILNQGMQTCWYNPVQQELTADDRKLSNDVYCQR